MRECGTCHVCCIWTPVNSYPTDAVQLNKPHGVACPYLNILKTSSGCCGIYTLRPQGCAGYKCAWLEGYGPPDMKPETSGILFESCEIKYEDANGNEGPVLLTLLMGFETKPGGMRRYEKALDAMATKGIVVGVVPFGAKFDQPDAEHEPVYFVHDHEDANTYRHFMQNVQRQGKIINKFANETIVQEFPNG